MSSNEYCRVSSPRIIIAVYLCLNLLLKYLYFSSLSHHIDHAYDIIRYVSVDLGCATPRYMRMSTYAPPTSNAVRTSTSLPFVAHVTPFALPENEEMDIPFVDFADLSGTIKDPLR